MEQIDNDGDEDLYITAVGEHGNFLFINDGAGHFSEQGAERGANCPTTHKNNGCSIGAGDIDNDGYLDLYVVSFVHMSVGHPLSQEGN